MQSKSENTAYIHPLSKSLMSSKSLEMCTESLCSETGSGAIDQFSHIIINRREKVASRKGKHGGSFPPPLTSMRSVQVHAHREGGRLLINAFAIQPLFRAERGDGRLRLSLLADDDGICWGDNPKLRSTSIARCNGATDRRVQNFQFCVVGV
ncbi:protein FANTASTIC FOUR 1-like [Salvia divinorum]